MPDTLLIPLPAWTDSPPTEPGVYRYKDEWDIHWVKVERIYLGADLCAIEFGSSPPVGVKRLPGQWQGPLVVEDSK